jgi:hypothetical protein
MEMPVLAQNRRHLGQRAGFVEQRHAQVDRARAFGVGRRGGSSVAAGWPKPGAVMPRAMSQTSPMTALAVGPSPAPGPRRTICSTASPSITTMLVPPTSCPSGLCAGHEAGRHALFQPAARHLRHAQKLDLVAQIARAADIVDGDPADPLQLHVVEGHRVPKAMEARRLSLWPASMPPTSSSGSASR